jgi:hypothetical protein
MRGPQEYFARARFWWLRTYKGERYEATLTIIYIASDALD